MVKRMPSRKMRPKHPIMMFEPDTFNNFIRVIEHLFFEEQSMIELRRSLVGTPRDILKLFRVLAKGGEFFTQQTIVALLEEHGHKYNID